MDFLVMFHTVWEGALRVVSKGLDLRGDLCLFLVVVFFFPFFARGTRKCCRTQAASWGQFQAAPWVPAPRVEKSREWLTGVVLLPGWARRLAAVGSMLMELQKAVCWREPLAVPRLRWGPRSFRAWGKCNPTSIASLFLFGVRGRWSTHADRSKWVSRKIWAPCCDC